MHKLAIFTILLVAMLVSVVLSSFTASAGVRHKAATGDEAASIAASDPMSVGSDNAPTADETLSEPSPLCEEQKKGHSFLTGFEQWLTLVILLFGALVLLVEYLLLKDTRKSSFELMQLFAVNLIITGTLVLISAGYSSSQIAPALGLFGTIAGYLLGRRSGQDNGKGDDKDG